MAAFEAVEMDVLVKVKIVSYHPKSVIEKQIGLMRLLNEAFEDAGKSMDFLAAPASVTIMQGESK